MPQEGAALQDEMEKLAGSSMAHMAAGWQRKPRDPRWPNPAKLVAASRVRRSCRVVQMLAEQRDGVVVSCGNW
jgi:hypothetical protein